MKTETKTCPECDGSGTVQGPMNFAVGIAVFGFPLPGVFEDTCDKCNGTGKVKVEKDEVR